MARPLTYEEMKNNPGIPIEKSPLELRVDALGQKVDTLMDLVPTGNVDRPQTTASLVVDEVRLAEQILICLCNCNLSLHAADGRPFPDGYSPTLALGQALAGRLKYPSHPAVYPYVMEVGRYDPDEDCPSA